MDTVRTGFHVANKNKEAMYSHSHYKLCHHGHSILIMRASPDVYV